MLIIVKILLTALVFSSLSISANENDLFNMSLEDLMQITVASKHDESLIDAAGVITVISAADIEKFGARNLRDVIDRVVNTQIIGSNLHPHNAISMRGVTQTHTDNKVLLLLNGNVIRDGNTGGLHSDIYNMFPLQLIKKIEIIRGPGSVIYGTNAFAGVLNIITFEAEQEIKKVSLTSGSFATTTVSAMIATSTEDYHLTLAANYIDTTGDIFSNINGEFGTSGDYPMDKKGYQLIASGNYGNLSFSGLYSSSDQGHIKSLFQFPSSTLTLNNTHLDIGYSLEVFSDWDLNSHVT